MRRLRVSAVVAAGVAIAATTGAPASAQSPVDATARLQGTFQMIGRLTVASHVRGERLGQTVARNWSFSSTCAAGPCPTVTLVRQRAGGSDTLDLQRRADGSYAGSASFYAALRCGATTYPTGERVPFTITVTVTNTSLQNGTPVASNVSATYTNLYRINNTPCVAILGKDSASYQGSLVGPARDIKQRRRR